MPQVRANERIQKVKMMIASLTKRRIEILRYTLITSKEDYPIQGPNLVQCHHKMFMLMITPKNFITFSTDKVRMNKQSKELMQQLLGQQILMIQLKKLANQRTIQTAKK